MLVDIRDVSRFCLLAGLAGTMLLLHGGLESAQLDRLGLTTSFDTRKRVEEGHELGGSAGKNEGHWERHRGAMAGRQLSEETLVLHELLGFSVPCPLRGQRPTPRVGLPLSLFRSVLLRNCSGASGGGSERRHCKPASKAISSRPMASAASPTDWPELLTRLLAGVRPRRSSSVATLKNGIRMNRLIDCPRPDSVTKGSDLVRPRDDHSIPTRCSGVPEERSSCSTRKRNYSIYSAPS